MPALQCCAVQQGSAPVFGVNVKGDSFALVKLYITAHWKFESIEQLWLTSSSCVRCTSSTFGTVT
jgi:hypothetical protein